MSDLLQSGHHPDADQLNAFVEHALPPHEYEQTLTHLAACPDCRSIVALSMPSIEEAPISQAEVVRRPWFSGWKIAWPAAAAVAALAIVAIHIRNTTNSRSIAVLPQRTDSRPPLPVPAPERSPIPKAGRGSVSDQRPANSSKATSPIGVSSRSDVRSDQNDALRAQTQSSPLSATTVINGRNFDPFIAGAAEGSAKAAAPPQNPAHTVTDPLHQDLIHAGTVASPAPPASPLASPAAVGGPLRQSQGVAPPPRANDAATLNAGNRNAYVTSGAPLVTSSNANGSVLNQAISTLPQRLLPSHLPAISMVSASHQTLAIDTQNTLFFSGDDGKSWKAIPPQWQGRAVKIALVSSAALAKVSSGVSASNSVSQTSFAMQTATERTQGPIASSTLTGKVTDATGAAIPDAAVVVTGTETTNSRTVKTDRTGSYVVGDLVPGRYQVAAGASGFQEQVSTVSVAASAQGLANFTLPVGSAAQTVAVEATPVPIPLDDSSSISKKKIAEPSATSASLPLFEITTEEGNHWISSDGQTWKRK